ncbi:putative transposase [Rhodoblastus acidophilus]|uniref:integrase catalytic domain-containing protein n=1 Tax=Rhodoblastus acidophilus TaxID=1074 RepID=UPI002224375F|nr:transposase family protein [Rhodoblastus acidophilus]MCW2282586.1 putative transposase [Rhodoblastus acidophilus]MCW2331447.1 putative transposase [Rhodoblastus acidophilus]
MGTQLILDFGREAVVTKHALKSGDVYELDGVRYVYNQSFAAPEGTAPEDWAELNEYLFLRERDGVRLQLTERRLDELIYDRLFKPAKEGKSLPRPLPPDGPKDPKARMRQFWCERYDEIQPMKSDASLKAFVEDVIAKYKNDAEFQGFPGYPEKIPHYWSICDWVEKRGYPGCRPLYLMCSKRSGRNHFPRVVEDLINEAIVWYWSGTTRDRVSAHIQIKEAIRQLNKKAEQDGGKPLPVLAYSTFCRRVFESENRATWGAKYGEKAAIARFDGTNPLPEAKRILHVVLIDSTTVDTHLVLGDDLLPLGRPTVNFAVDLYSRALLAIFLTFEQPNLHMAMATLKRVLLPKLDLMNAFPEMRVTLEPYGTPSIVVVDNAWAQAGHSYRDACADMGIDLRFAPIHTPQAKPYVERIVDTFHRLVFHKAPGGIPYDTKVLRKLGFDPQKTQVLDINELWERVIEAMNVYHLKEHDGIGVAPIIAWRASALVHGIDVCPNPDHLEAAAGEVLEASLTRQGIKLEGVVYHDQRTVTHLMDRLAPIDSLKSKRRTSQRARVKIKRNPADLTVIHVWNRRDEEYVPLPADNANFLMGLTKTQAKTIKIMAEQAGLPFDTDVECCKARVQLIQRLEDAKPQWLKDEEKKRQRILLADRPGLISGSILRVAAAPARHDGMAPIIDESGVHVPIDHGRRAGGGEAVKGSRRGGKAATRKATATRRNSKALSDALNAQAAAERESPSVKTVHPAKVEFSVPPRSPPSEGKLSMREQILASLAASEGWGPGSQPSKKE